MADRWDLNPRSSGLPVICGVGARCPILAFLTVQSRDRRGDLDYVPSTVGISSHGIKTDGCGL